MKYIVWFVWFCIMCFPFTSLKGQGISAKAALEQKIMYIGDQQNLTIQLPYQEGLEIVDSKLTPLYRINEIEWLDSTNFQLIEGPEGKVYQQTIRLTSFDSGQYLIPEIPIRYRFQNREGTARTSNLLLGVMTIPTQESVIAPIKPIAEEGINMEDLWLYAALVLGSVLIGLLLYFIRFRKKEIELPPPPPPPAHEVALEKLDALKAKQLWQKGEVKAYHSELSYILREYIENRFDIQALEQTTSEIQRDLEQTDVSSDWKTKLGQLLQTADMVKFAKVIPPASFHNETWDQVAAFVRSTKKVIPVNIPEPSE